MKSIDVYPTRIEVYPWYKVSWRDPVITNSSSDFNPKTRKRDSQAFMFDEEHQKLILMRGMEINWLAKMVDGYPHFKSGMKGVRMKYKYRVHTLPRSSDQIRAIKFLAGIGEYEFTTKYSQLTLNSEPGFGKTYCTIVTMLERRERTIIIVPSTIIGKQWIDSLMEHTTMKRERIKVLHGKEDMDKIYTESVDADILITTHSTLGQYIRNEGVEKTRSWFDRMKCGTKIIDEAHYWFNNTVMIDFCSNIEKNYYLTASMTRSNSLEVRLFKRYFGSAVSIGEEFEYTKNVVYTFVDYDSSPSMESQVFVMTSRGPSPSRFAKYAYEMDEYHTAEIVLLDTLREARTHDGRTLVIASRIFACEKIKEIIQKQYPDLVVATVHSRNKVEDNFAAKDHADIIIATVRGLGFGADIQFLRTIIITEIYSSEVTAIQLPKRLRPWEDGSDSYCYDLCDYGFDFISSQVKKRTRVLKKRCKVVQHQEFTNY